MSGFTDVDRPSRALIDACVHCGFCLPSCPTYALWGEEMDSPRGRIYLMKAALEGRAGVSATFVEHFDRCLGCMACVTACPSGVQYGPLVERTRAQVEQQHTRPLGERLFRALLFRVLPYSRRMRLAMVPLVLLARLTTRWAPLALARRVTFGRLFDALPACVAAKGERRLRVGLLTGCVQRVMFADVHHATLRVLAAEGCETIVPPQGCCGALSRHAGRLEEARAFARRTIEAFERANADVIVVNAAGCGSSMKEYGELLEDDPAWAQRAQAFATRVRDVSEVLAGLEPRAARHPLPVRVVYQDACHLAHAQRLRHEPRALLAGIPGVTLVEIPESDMCCGSAGIYNLVQPDAANALGARKAAHIAAARPDVVASGNPGCAAQITAASERLGSPVRVVHPIQLLDASIHDSRLT